MKAMTRNRKSIRLEKYELKDFIKLVKSFHTLVEAAEHFGFSIQVLIRAMKFGSAAPETVYKIRAKI